MPKSFHHCRSVALFTRAWIEIFFVAYPFFLSHFVALFTRAWIEMEKIEKLEKLIEVALFTRAWIEIALIGQNINVYYVALFTRAWIEIYSTAS